MRSKHSRLTHRQGGFALVELLGGLFVAAVLIPVGLNLLYLGHLARIRSQQLIEVQESFAPVWERWLETSGGAALARRKETGEWEVFDFPDAGWLPEAGTSGGMDSRICVWKRELAENYPGFSFWRVYSRGSHDRDWRWHHSILLVGGGGS